MSGSRDLAYLCRELKHPSLLAGVERLAERARADAWSHEDFLAACLEREVSARQSHGGEARIHNARFPARKTLEDFDFDHQRSVRKDVVAHLGALPVCQGRLRPLVPQFGTRGETGTERDDDAFRARWCGRRRRG